MVVNFEVASRFLKLLDDVDDFTFQTFAEAAKGAVRPRVLHGPFLEHAEPLAKENNHGAGVFAMVNAGNGVVLDGAKTCRTAENVERVRAVFVDLDGAPIEPVLASALPPDWVVRSSPRRWHAYWRVDDCPLDRFALVQVALALQFKGDPSVKDLPRVMRIPGFLHQKSQPFCSELWLPDDYQNISKEMS